MQRMPPQRHFLQRGIPPNNFQRFRMPPQMMMRPQQGFHGNQMMRGPPMSYSGSILGAPPQMKGVKSRLGPKPAMSPPKPLMAIRTVAPSNMRQQVVVPSNQQPRMKQVVKKAPQQVVNQQIKQPGNQVNALHGNQVQVVTTSNQVQVTNNNVQVGPTSSIPVLQTTNRQPIVAGRFCF